LSAEVETRPVIYRWGVQMTKYPEFLTRFVTDNGPNIIVEDHFGWPAVAPVNLEIIQGYIACAQSLMPNETTIDAKRREDETDAGYGVRSARLAAEYERWQVSEIAPAA
jgi:hypothetical protein